jgi:cysteinyl-tRNA synthetase
METLGEQIDIHGGGTDLCFPHHENEIAQSESATGKPFVRHWFHVEHLLVDGQKMSKSLGNMYTVREVLERGYTGRELRYALLSGANYRKNLNFTWQGMDDAKAALARIDEWRKRIGDYVTSTAPAGNFIVPPDLKRELGGMIDRALADDLNINEALGHLFVWIRTCHREIDDGSFNHGKAEAYLTAWKSLDSVLGLGEPSVSVPAEVQALIVQRADARKAKDFARSDALRGQIEALRWKVKDTAKGQEVSPL